MYVYLCKFIYIFCVIVSLYLTVGELDYLCEIKASQISGKDQANIGHFCAF